MERKEDTRALYNDQATEWRRTEPILLSDYSARPFVLDLCEPLTGKSVLDAGCGEGYAGRELLKRGAAFVRGIDISEKMIEQAIAQQTALGITNAAYEAGDVRMLSAEAPDQYDLVLAMFLFNYLNVEDTHQVMQQIYRLLKPGGHFVYSVPHPFLAFLKKDKYPFYFEQRGGYFSGRNILFPGEIWRRDGVSVGVQCIHKTIEDYFTGLQNAGFSAMPSLHELHIQDSHVALDKSFFSPLADLPLHIAFKVQK